MDIGCSELIWYVAVAVAPDASDDAAAGDTIVYVLELGTVCISNSF